MSMHAYHPKAILLVPKYFQEEKADEPEKDLSLEGIVLKLPHTIRNISTKMTLSNSFMISKNNTYAVAGVR